MLETIVIVLLILWALGVVGGGVMYAGGLLHVLLVIAIVLIIIRLLRGQSALP